MLKRLSVTVIGGAVVSVIPGMEDAVEEALTAYRESIDPDADHQRMFEQVAFHIVRHGGQFVEGVGLVNVGQIKACAGSTPHSGLQVEVDDVWDVESNPTVSTPEQTP